MSQNPPSLNDVQSMSKSYDADKTAEAMNGHAKKTWFSDFKLLYNMLEDRRFKTQGSTKMTIGGALAYVVLPTDVVPDFIPMLGWVDDAMVLKLVMDAAKGEIKRYRQFIAQAA